MKANGRRRWRKWLAGCRKRGDGYGADIGRCKERTAYTRRHRGSDAGQGIPSEPPSPPAKPFTPRSLVGMSESAKKRRAESHTWAAMPAMIPTFRKSWHIGERLRPCPGCLRCRSCAGCEVLTFEGDTCEDCGRETPMATESCDGTGVLPARRAK